MPRKKCNTLWLVLVSMLVVLLVAGLFWLANRPPAVDGADGNAHAQTGMVREMPAAGPASTQSRPAALRIGLIPERNIFQQRDRYEALAGYIAARLGRPVKLATLNTYDAVLGEFREKKIDAAFLGSLVAVLAMDRLDARVIVKPEHPGGISTYRGVVFVRADSPITSIDQLPGHSIAMVRTTTAGDLFPFWLMVARGMLKGPKPPQIRWVGTHDDAVRAIISGDVDVGAAKDLRIDALLRSHPAWKIRRLAIGKPVPENALLVRGDEAAELGPQLRNLLLNMAKDPQGQAALKAFGAIRFIPCDPAQYSAIYDMVDRLGPAWSEIGVAGPAPHRPEGSANR